MYKPTAFVICVAALAAACTTTAPGARPESKTVAAVAAPPCVQATGTHIPRTGRDDCIAGRVYTGDQIRNTGRLDPADALQTLDPSITVHH